MGVVGRGRRRLRAVVACFVAGLVGLSVGLSVTAAGDEGNEGGRAARSMAVDIGDVSSYPQVSGGKWVRGPNLVDAGGRFQARQEHAAVELNGFVYLIGGFVPIEPPPQPTVNEPEPFPFEGTGDVLVYTPSDHPSAAAGDAGKWSTLPDSSSFPVAHMHHIVAVAHEGRIWAFGGHEGDFVPTDSVYVFTPNSRTVAEGTWTQVRAADGQACSGSACLKLPQARAAGAAVSIGSRIYLMGGVEPWENSPDPVNASIRTTGSVLSLDTDSYPLRWEVEPSLNDPREHFNAAVAGGRVFAFHGRNERSTHLRGVESWSPGDPSWRTEQDAPVGTSANVLAKVGRCVYSFGGEFIASNVTGTLINSQVFHLPTRSWRLLESRFQTEPLDATGATSKHGTYGVVFQEDGRRKVMAPGGAATAWFDPMSKVHVFVPPQNCK
jgi:hypothetical protein